MASETTMHTLTFRVIGQLCEQRARLQKELDGLPPEIGAEHDALIKLRAAIDSLSGVIGGKLRDRGFAEDLYHELVDIRRRLHTVESKWTQAMKLLTQMTRRISALEQEKKS